MFVDSQPDWRVTPSANHALRCFSLPAMCHPPRIGGYAPRHLLSLLRQGKQAKEGDPTSASRWAGFPRLRTDRGGGCAYQNRPRRNPARSSLGADVGELAQTNDSCTYVSQCSHEGILLIGFGRYTPRQFYLRSLIWGLIPCRPSPRKWSETNSFSFGSRPTEAWRSLATCCLSVDRGLRLAARRAAGGGLLWGVRTRSSD